jgi:hypothetical protein
MNSTGGYVKGWGCEDAPIPLNETGQEMSEMFWGRFSAWIDGGLGDV